MRKLLVLVFLLFALINRGFTQTGYPIFVTPTLAPPYSLKLSEYSKFGSQRMVVNIAVNDLNISNLPVKLHIKLETVGVTIETPVTINTTPIYLDGGAVTILFGDDLADYFNINNLIFKGYSKESYRRTGQLPEGFYKITVEVLHYQTNRLISNSGTATAWITLGKPPVLKLPENNKVMGEFKGMPLTFSWLPCNLGNPVSAGSVQYKFEMWEMRVDGVSPYVVASTVPVFYEETTSNTLLSVYPATMLMEPGMKYAWRVTASDMNGFVPFEQDGHSEIRVFSYKSKCDSVTNFKAEARGRSGLFGWQPKSNHTSYNVELRNPETGWLSASETFDNKVEFQDLEYGSTYEIRTQAVCDNDPSSLSDFTAWHRLEVPDQRTKPDSATCPNCGCDDNIIPKEIENLELNRNLKPGDTLVNRAGTTRFIVKTATQQGDGVYKGIFLFWAELWKVKFVCEYWDLSANTDNVILNMDFKSVYNPQFLLDVDVMTAYLDSLASAITTLTINTTISDTLTVNGSISTVYVNEGDSVIVVTVGENGELTEIVIGTDSDDLGHTLITGEDGEEYVVTGNGEVMGVDEFKNTGGNDRKIEEYKEEKESHLSATTVNFAASPTQKYGFDAYTEQKQALRNGYPALGNGYVPSYKSVASFATDKVVPSSFEKGITFRDEMGIPAVTSGGELTLRGRADGIVTSLYAYKAITDTTEEVAGKLEVMCYDQQVKKLYIVPVNNAKLPDVTALQNVLNTVYAQAVTRWEVVPIKESVPVTFPNGQMTHGGSSAIAVYNADQNAIISKFKENNSLESNALYLFFVDNVVGKTGDVAGYMPLQRQVGFIYDSPNLFVIAHELGHGAFNLRHTFSPENFIAAEHSTQNLMDYNGGTELWKHQWEFIRDPQSVWFAWAQDESEGEYVEEGPISEVTRFINTIKCAKSKNLETTNIHHAVNSYSVKVGDLLERLNKYRGSQSIASDEFKKTYLNVYIDEGLFSSASDLYLGYHNFQLSVNDYERKQAQGIDSEKLIFTANGKPIIFSFPIGTDANIQKDVLDWIERECGIKTGGSPFENIRFNVDSDDVKDLFSLSICQLEQLNKEDRKKLIGHTLKNVHNFLGWDKDTYQYLLANLIMSTPKSDVEELVAYLSGIGGDLEASFLELAPTAKEVFVQGLCELAKKSWKETQYLGDLNSYFLGLRSIQKDELNRVLLGVCGTFNLQPGKYEFSYSVWVSDNGMFPSNDPNPQGIYEVSAFDPIECNIINDNAEIEGTQIMPAIVVKLYAINLHIANIDELLNIAKMVILPEFSGAVFLGANRIGNSTVTLFKGFTKGITSATGRFLGNCGKLGYKLKKSGTEIALYTNLNIEIARFSGTGKLMTKVYPYNKAGVRVLSWEDEVEYISTTNTSKTGKLELARADDGVIFFRELVASRFVAKSGSELKNYLSKLEVLPQSVSYKGVMYRNIPKGLPNPDPRFIVRTPSSDVNNRFTTGLYLSENKAGNKFEAIHYNGTTEGRELYKFTDVEIDGLLDLTNPTTVETLGTSFEQMKLKSTNNAIQYEYTYEVAMWAKSKGYKGIKFNGVRSDASDYVNFVIFDETTVEKTLSNFSKTNW